MDEAKKRKGFHSFLSDVADQSGDRFALDHAPALDFANSELRVLKPDDRFAIPEREALRLLLEQLRSRTESDGDRFAGMLQCSKRLPDK